MACLLMRRRRRILSGCCGGIRSRATGSKSRRQETEGRRQNKTCRLRVLFIEHTSAGQNLSVRRGRPGLTVNTVGLIAVGFPAANSLSRIFVRIGNGLNGPTFTIPDSMHGSLDCAARELQSPGYSVDAITNAMTPQAVDGLRNSSTTVMRRMLASIKKRGRSFGWRTSSDPTLICEKPRIGRGL